MNSENPTVIIGSGPGGHSVAMRLIERSAERGSVILIERDQVGGVCLNRGCVPTKSWIGAVETFFAATRFNRAFSRSPVDPGQIALDFAKVQAHRSSIVANFRKSLRSTLLKGGVELIDGVARFKSGAEIEVDLDDGRRRSIRFANAIIATGAKPLNRFELKSAPLHTSSTIFDIDRAPESIIIIGGGYIGLEFATFFNALRTSCSIVEAEERIAPMIDKEIGATLEREFKKRKIELITGEMIESIEPTAGGGVRARLSRSRRELEASIALVAIGSEPNASELGLENFSARLDARGYIEVDRNFRTARANIYAIGDVIGRSALAYTAASEGVYVADLISGARADEYIEPVVPAALFTDPEIGYVGCSEEVAPAGSRVYRSRARANPRSHAGGELVGMTKLIADKDEKLIGAHIIGARATDLIHIASMAIEAGFTIDRLRSMLFAHPTFAEGIFEALDNESPARSRA